MSLAPISIRLSVTDSCRNSGSRVIEMSKQYMSYQQIAFDTPIGETSAEYSVLFGRQRLDECLTEVVWAERSGIFRR